MIHLLILIALGLATYLFHNYQEFDDSHMRPWIVEQVNFNREADPQALCDLLALDAVVNITDEYTRYKYKIVNGSKSEACDYFIKSANNFEKPQREKNGYIWDRLTDYFVNYENLFQDYADVTFSTDVKPSSSFSGLTTKQGDILIGKTTTRITVKSPIFRDTKITYYEFKRKLTQLPTSN
ncbi:MAG: hypothetical protein Q4A74_07220 [Cardiobacteriaceae bacterium]|nr:hypothetical protein [Cardiobacteriaceae bacterium]